MRRTRAGQDTSAPTIEGEKADGAEYIVYQNVQHSISLITSSAFVVGNAEASLMKHKRVYISDNNYIDYLILEEEIEGEKI